MRRLIAVALVALTGCTPREISMWQDWHTTDPDAAVAFAKNLPPAPVLVDHHGGKWQSIAYCESGGRWDYPPVTNRTGTYSGGLMIWQRAWVAYGGQQFAPWAYQATKAEQITVAERILADRGWGAWDCA